jgi:hypothetical protein
MTTVASEVLFNAEQYTDDLEGFRRAYAEAYLQALRKGVPVKCGPLTGAQEKIVERLKTDAHHGDRSVRRSKKVFRGKPCSLKRHFKSGCFKEIVGMAELLARKDRERFIWNRHWNEALNGTKGKYSSRQIKRCECELEGWGIFTPARRERNGLKTGWIVAKHADVTTQIGDQCVLNLNPFVISPRRRGERLDRYVREHGNSTATCLADVISSGPNVISDDPNVISDVISKNPDVISDASNSFPEKGIEEGARRTGGASPYNPFNPFYPSGTDEKTSQTAVEEPAVWKEKEDSSSASPEREPSTTVL